MTITLNRKQAYTLQEALDMYTRMGSKQLEIILGEMDDEYFVLNPKIEKEVTAIKRKLWDLDLHEGGISCVKQQKYREAYSMMKIIQKHLYDSHPNPPSICTWSDGNCLQLNKEPDIAISKE